MRELLILSVLVVVSCALQHGSVDSDPRLANATAGVYRGPIANGGRWTAAFQRARALVEHMSIEEKVNFTTGFTGPCEGNIPGLPRLGLPRFCLQDGPTGLRFESFVSQFPTQHTIAATWDRDLIEMRAVAIGEEFRGRGVHTILGPVTGGPLGRSPLGGRNWENFSPDPYLTSIASYITVRGIQSQGIITSLKHFLGYEQETFRNARWRVNGSVQSFRQISSDVDDRTLHETYLPSFAEAVRAGAGSVMCSYNSFNGTHACENEHLLNTLLKGELNFQGFVLSDWDATWSNLSSALNGLDQTMPGQGLSIGGDYGLTLISLVRNGSVPESRLDDMVIRILTPFFHLRQNENFPKSPTNKPRDLVGDDEVGEGWEMDDFGGSEGGWAQKVFGGVRMDEQGGGEDVPDVQGEHWKLIRQIGEESATLLKNVDSALPIKSSTRRLAVFGSDAGPSILGIQSCGFDSSCSNDKRPFYWPGTLTTGGGSGTTYAPYVISPLEGISTRARRSRVQVDFVLSDTSYLHINRTSSLATQCIVFVSAFAMEGFDRPSLSLDNHGDRLVETVAALCRDTVVVIHAPGPVDMERWIEHANVSAVVFAFFPGQESGNAIASVLFGDINPSGKLPFTIGRTISDWPHGAESIVRDEVDQPNATFSEGNFIDYRWFDKRKIEPRFEFGFGLSYTSFEYGDAVIEMFHKRDDAAPQETNEVFEGQGGLYDVIRSVSVNVTNSGVLTGSEVVQLYISFPDSFSRTQPPRLLRGFDKLVGIAPGQTRAAALPLRNKDLAVWDVVKQLWRLPSRSEGDVVVRVGSSSRTLGKPVSLHL